MIQQGLSMRHQHRHEPNAYRMFDDLHQLLLAARAPIGVGQVTASKLQSTARSLEAAVGFYLLFHFHERRNRYFVCVLRQITMRTTEGAITCAGNKSAVGQMATG